MALCKWLKTSCGEGSDREKPKAKSIIRHFCSHQCLCVFVCARARDFIVSEMSRRSALRLRSKAPIDSSKRKIIQYAVKRSYALKHSRSILVFSSLQLLGKPIRCVFPCVLALHATGSICVRMILLMEPRMYCCDRCIYAPAAQVC